MKIDLSKIKKATIIRFLILVLGLVNIILQMNGKNVLPITDEQITTIISDVWVVASAIWCYWKNNNISENAIKAQEVLDSLNEGTTELPFIDGDDK